MNSIAHKYFFMGSIYRSVYHHHLTKLSTRFTMKHYARYCLCILFLSACAKDIPVYNTTDQTYSIFLSDSAGKIARVTMPENRIADAHYYFSVNKEEINGAVEWMKEFRDNIYIGIPSRYLILVVNKYSFKKIGQFDFSSSRLLPSDIAFVNATNAYVAHENDSTLSLIDLFSLSVARTVACGKNPTAVTAIEQQVFAACRGDNTIRRLDARTNTVTATYSTPPSPILLTTIRDENLSASNRRLLLVCNGDENVTASVSLMDINGTFTGTQNITQTATKEKPRAVAVTTTDFAFIATQTSIWRYDIRKPDIPRRISPSAAEDIYYNLRRNELIIQRTPTLIQIAQSNDTKIISSINTTSPVRALIEIND